MSRIGRTVTPGVFTSTSRNVIPRCFGAASGSVRTRTNSQSAWWPSEVHTFCPSTT
jgi:hypothetical protein